MSKLVIGITGGIGSGKSTLSNIFEKKGHIVILSDDIAKELMFDDNDVKKKIINEFGQECYGDGQLNTKILAEKVFNHPEQMKKINSIVHPPTISEIQNRVKKALVKYSIVFVESALIFEANMVNMFDYVLLITADEDTRIKRILDRDVETVSEIKSRMMNQLPEERKISRSDFVIHNDSSVEQLNEKAQFFLNLFKTLPSRK